MPVIYHITTAAAWKKANEKGSYEHDSLKQEGFIHCSQAEQVPGVLERYFSGQKDIVKLIIDTDLLSSKHVFEWSPSTHDTFPHVYGPINIDSVIAVETIN
jgi:uncharacterized protein (DUF952 family)